MLFSPCVYLVYFVFRLFSRQKLESLKKYNTPIFVFVLE